MKRLTLALIAFALVLGTLTPALCQDSGVEDQVKLLYACIGNGDVDTLLRQVVTPEIAQAVKNSTSESFEGIGNDLGLVILATGLVKEKALKVEFSELALTISEKTESSATVLVKYTAKTEMNKETTTSPGEDSVALTWVDGKWLVTALTDRSRQK